LGPFGEKEGGIFIEKSNDRLVLGGDGGEGHLPFLENWLNFMTTTPGLKF
jgi:hypothetical protein